jgi:hypothetical protein
MAGITSSGAAARWRGTFHLGSKAAASTGKRGTRCSPMVQGDPVVKVSVKRCATQ